WSFALALRLAAYDLLRSDGGEPVLILDDVFAELDDTRRQQLADLVAPAEQVLITAAVAADVPEQLSGARYDVAAGEVHRVRWQTTGPGAQPAEPCAQGGAGACPSAAAADRR